MIQLLCIVLVLVLLESQGSVVCPVTSTMNRTNLEKFVYPINIYAPHHVLSSVNHSSPCINHWNGTKISNLCSLTDTTCPLNMDAVRIAAVHHNKTASLCRFKPLLHNSANHIRVIVSGGSLINGVHSTGCINETETSRDDSRCSWFMHFGQWIKREYPANISFHRLVDFRQRADSITHRQKRLAQILLYNGIQKFSSNDIVFLDHSIEDDNSPVQEVEDALELLIRRIYLQSEKNSWPSIVVLDSAPIRNTNASEPSLSSIYLKIASQYNALVWSFRDAVLAGHLLPHSHYDFHFVNKTSAMLPEIHHPPWHVHLFMADMYAAIFQAEMKHCTDHIVAKSSKLHSSALSFPVLRTRILTECENNSNSIFDYVDIKNGPEKFVSKATNAAPAYRIVKLDKQFTRWPADYQWHAVSYDVCGHDKHALEAYNTVRVDSRTSKWNWNSDADINRELAKVYNDSSIKNPTFKPEVFLSLLRDKTMGIIGDSLSGQMFDGILNVMRVHQGNVTYGMLCKEHTSKRLFTDVSIAHFYNYNATIYRMDSVRFNLNNSYPCPLLAGTDVLIIAVGAWFKPMFRGYAPGNYTQSFELSRKQLNDTLRLGYQYIRTHSPQTKVMWRVLSHFGKMDIYNLMDGNTGCLNHWDGFYWSQSTQSSFWTERYNDVIRAIAKENNEAVIDWFTLSLEYMKYFTHKGHSVHVDSGHYCADTVPKGGVLLVQDALYDLYHK